MNHDHDKEKDAIVELNHKQFLELEYLRPIFKAAKNLLYHSEEYQFDDGLGMGAVQEHWDDLISALEPTKGAIKSIKKTYGKPVQHDDWLDTSKACNLEDGECEACQ